MSAASAFLPDGRLHLQHGPIDLLIGCNGDDRARTAALGAAEARFQTMLQELVEELPLLRSQVTEDSPLPRGQIARAMHRATLPHADRFVTPMAAVAGAVADTILGAMTDAAPLPRAYVNNGGDIALHLTGDASFAIAMADHDGSGLGRIDIHANDGIGGIATSGRHGRSLSMGIADSVTVLARTAAEADAAATLIANAVDLPGHPRVRRAPASDLDPDSDLGARLVVTGRNALDPSEVARALDAGGDLARDMHAHGLIASAALFLDGQSRILGRNLTATDRSLLHA